MLNVKIPSWAHATIVFALGALGVVSFLNADGTLHVAVPVMSALAMLASVLHSVDPKAQ